MKIFSLIEQVIRISRTLSEKQKLEYLPQLIHRDDGFNCFFCKTKLVVGNFIFEHLNRNRSDNRLENLVLACQSCNIKKVSDSDLQILAKQKLKENESKIFLREKICIEDPGPHNVSTEIDINITNFAITKQHISEVITTDEFILYKDAINSSTYLCHEKTGHGSQQSVRNYIDMLISDVGPFMITRDENGKKIIVKKKGQ